jgi:hypothetical protein
MTILESGDAALIAPINRPLFDAIDASQLIRNCRQAA